MNSSKKTISYITILLVVVATVLAGIWLFIGNGKPLNIICRIVSLIAMVPSFIYACNGYKKDVAVYYKAFMSLYALSAAIMFATDLKDTLSAGSSYFSTIICAIVLIDYLILAFAKDFGKQKSLAVAYCVLAAQLISFIRMLIKFSSIPGIVISACLNLIVSVVACLFVYAKYQDKAERGAK